jgi:predicted Zn-dependent peptidase
MPLPDPPAPPPAAAVATAEVARIESIPGLAFPLAHARLPNGFDVYVQQRPDAASATGYLVFRAGSRYETAADNGVSHLLEHMVFVQTERWSEDEVRAAIDRNGGRYNGFTQAEQVGYWTQMPAGRTAEMLDWLSQVAFHPLLPAEKLDKEREVVFEERDGRDGWTRRALQDVGLGRPFRTEIRRALFPGSSRALPVIGEDTSLDGATIDTVKAFYARHYHAGNAALVYVGPESPESLVAAATERFGAIPGGEASHPPADTTPVRLGGRTTVRDVEIVDRCTVTLAARGPGLTDADVWTTEVLLDYLRTLLYDTLRGNKGLTYGIAAYNHPASDGGEIAIDSDTDCAHVDEIADAFDAAVEDVRAGKVDEDRLARSRNGVAGRWALDAEDGRTRAAWIASFLPLDQPFANAARQDAVPRVTATDVVAAANRWLPPDQRGIFVHRPLLTITQAWVAGIAAGLVGVLARWVRRSRTAARGRQAA